MRHALLLTIGLSHAVAAPSPWPQLCPKQPADAFSQVRCPASATCAANGFSGAANNAACCPFANAVACPGGFQCCPSGNTCALISGSGYSQVYKCVAPAGGANTTSQCACKPGAPLAASTTKKNVLIIGDSLSLGYTPIVTANLSDIALVQHAPWGGDGGAEEAAYLESCLDFWLASPSGIPFIPDLLWFNSGMHNYATGTPGNGTVPGQSGNSTAESYANPLARVTARLASWAAANKVKLIYALTTPYLNDASIDATITGTLNVAARGIMASEGIQTIDLHTPIIEKCGPVPQASCFGEKGCWSPHCPPGYRCAFLP